ncbi:hypothetical protein JEQ12_004269 [Ovis aries]|uniref:Uncharacterized protein n=1 Tax=Ovis aries TaxID=9940 RepID=A0A835ZVN3_SHEEP|nr:hypothetical protein JEQ12_004269 [Ovis aries]
MQPCRAAPKPMSVAKPTEFEQTDGSDLNFKTNLIPNGGGNGDLAKNLKTLIIRGTRRPSDRIPGPEKLREPAVASRRFGTPPNFPTVRRTQVHSGSPNT